MDVLDLVLLGAVVVFAISGYRQGMLVGVLGLVGFFGGAALGAYLAPGISSLFSSGDKAPVVGLLIVFLGACLGQLIASALGATLRARLTWEPAQLLDSAAGALTSGISVLLVAWLLASVVDRSPYPGLRRQVNASRVIVAVDTLMPDSARRLLDGVKRLVDQQNFPQVFAGLGGERIVPAGPPDPALAGSAIVRSVRSRVLKVRGIAPSCDRQVEGSGFVYAPGRLMTNAHVVAGVQNPRVETLQGSVAARVVLFDPERDVAVLEVPGLAVTPLQFVSHAAAPGTDAIVLGYPQDGPYTATAARVRNRELARGNDIYSQGTVTRDIYGVRGLVRPGNSGGPLLTSAGQVLGVVFAAATDDPQTGFALTAAEVSGDAALGRVATQRVSTGACD